MEIFKSRRFWSAVIGLVVMILTAFVPELNQHVDVIIPAVMVVIGILIGGYTAEDVMNARKS